MTGGYVLLKLLSRADGVVDENYGRFVVRYDPQLVDHVFILETTADQTAARKFTDTREAWEYWGQICPNIPLRPDGMLNRPLTAWNAEVVANDPRISRLHDS